MEGVVCEEISKEPETLSTVSTPRLVKKPGFPPYIWREPLKDTPAAASARERPAANDDFVRHGSVATQHTALLNYKSCHDPESDLRLARAQIARDKREGHKKTLEGLKGWIRNVTSTRKTNGSISGSSSSHAQEQENLVKLAQVAQDAFPPRMELPVIVCDVKEDSADVYEIQLNEIEYCWKDRPDDVLLRWIHAPLGHGIVHSSIEDMFRHDKPPGRPFRNAGLAGFPFLDLDALHLRDIDNLNHMRNVHEELQELDALSAELTRTTLDNDDNVTFRDDIDWRHDELGTTPSFWDAVLSDIPLELGESFSSGGGEGPLRPLSLGRGPLDPSAFSYQDYKPYQKAKLAWAPFRCFHRSDGTLLTMSAAAGVDLIHRDMESHLQQTPLDLLQNPQSSVIGRQMQALKDHGARNWYQHTAEYYLVHLVSEIGITPHNLYSGHSGPSVLSILRCTVRNLKRRRFAPWTKKQSEQLVKDYIHCLDELRGLGTCFERRITFFEKLAVDVQDHEDQDNRAIQRKQEKEQRRLKRQETDLVSNPRSQKSQDSVEFGDVDQWNFDEKEPLGSTNRHLNDQEGTTPLECIDRALRINRHQKKIVDSLIDDATRALESFFQMRSIEQNERAINNESRNSAIFIFTGVTVVFLPLSFLASYFGMNIEGIKNSTRSESNFWEICGTVTVVCIFVIALCAVGKCTFAGLPKKKKPRVERRVRPTKMDLEAGILKNLSHSQLPQRM